MRWIFSAIGWCILRIKFCSEEERQRILNQKYDGYYATVGAEYPIKILAAVFIIVLIGLLAAISYSIFKHGPAPV